MKHTPKLECQKCNEVSLEYKSVSDHKPFIETWECDCGHTECFHVAEPRTPLDEKLIQLAFYKGVREGIKMTKEKESCKAE